MQQQADALRASGVHIVGNPDLLPECSASASSDDGLELPTEAATLALLGALEEGARLARKLPRRRARLLGPAAVCACVGGWQTLREPCTCVPRPTDPVLPSRQVPWSGQVEEPVEHPGTELQRVHRDPLVDAVEHPGEVEVGGQLERCEPEAPDPQSGERLGVGARRTSVYGTARAAGSSACRASHIASTSAPSKSVSSAMSWMTKSRVMSGPITASICSKNSSSKPGRKRPSTKACASPGITLCL